MVFKKEIIILSPHLDDAVLSCCDHLSLWKRNGFRIEVISIFTEFIEGVLSPSTMHYVEASGFKSVPEFKRARIKEDVRTMKYLGVEYKHVGLIDAGFRSRNGEPIYRNEKTIFSGKIPPRDSLIFNEVRQALEPMKNRDCCIIPLAVGKHADHIIVRDVAEEIFEHQNLCYYVDNPYALFPWNWMRDQALRMLKAPKSIRWMTKKKRETINIYSSQTPFLGILHKFFCPEIILLPFWGAPRAILRSSS